VAVAKLLRLTAVAGWDAIKHQLVKRRYQRRYMRAPRRATPAMSERTGP
jgi:hypothetical protein